MRQFIKDYAPWVFVVFLFFYIFMGGFNKQASSNKSKSDTIYVEKTIKIPEIVGSVNNPNPTIIVNPTKTYDEELLKYLRSLSTKEEVLEACKEATQIREYKNTYASDKDSTVVVTVEDSTAGRLLNQKMSFKVKEREVKYQEKIINNYLKPKFVISAGGSAQLPTSPLAPKPAVGGVVGFKNKAGYNLDFGYNTNQQFEVTLKKDIFTFWGKPDK